MRLDAPRSTRCVNSTLRRRFWTAQRTPRGRIARGESLTSAIQCTGSALSTGIADLQRCPRRQRPVIAWWPVTRAAPGSVELPSDRTAERVHSSNPVPGDDSRVGPAPCRLSPPVGAALSAATRAQPCTLEWAVRLRQPGGGLGQARRRLADRRTLLGNGSRGCERGKP